MSETNSKHFPRYYSRPHTKDEKKQQKRKRDKRRKRDAFLKRREDRQQRKTIKSLDVPDEQRPYDEAIVQENSATQPQVPSTSVSVDVHTSHYEQEKLEIPTASNTREDRQQRKKFKSSVDAYEHRPCDKVIDQENPMNQPQVPCTSVLNGDVHTSHEQKKLEISTASKLSTTRKSTIDDTVVSSYKQRSESRGKQMVMLAKKAGEKHISEPVVVFQKPSSASYLARQYRASSVSRAPPQPVREIDYELITKSSDIPIGNGTFGTCYLAKYRDIKVAVKEMNKRESSFAEKERCRREVLHEATVLQALGDHPNLPLILGMCSVKEPYCLVLQFLGTGTETLTLQKAVRRRLLDKVKVIQVFRDICGVVQYVHKKGYLHNDIKSNNVLLETVGETEYRAILIDFGKTKPIAKGEKRKRAATATYIAPEVVKGDKETTASDVFSLGKMLSLAVSSRSFKCIFTNLVEDMTCPSPSKRPSTQEIISCLDKLIPAQNS